MKNNRFYQHRAEIKAISEKMGLDVSSASRALAHEKDWVDYQNELNAWDEECIKYVKHSTKTLADLFK